MAKEMHQCAYCRTIRPESEMKPGKIIFRSRRWDPRKGKNVVFVDEKTNWYCADKPCHVHDQMAHEG